MCIRDRISLASRPGLARATSCDRARNGARLVRIRHHAVKRPLVQFFTRLLVCTLLVSLAHCSARSDNTKIKLASPAESTTLGPGDLFTVDIVGEKELPRDFQVASDGTVD